MSEVRCQQRMAGLRRSPENGIPVTMTLKAKVLLGGITSFAFLLGLVAGSVLPKQSQQPALEDSQTKGRLNEAVREAVALRFRHEVLPHLEGRIGVLERVFGVKVLERRPILDEKSQRLEQIIFSRTLTEEEVFQLEPLFSQLTWRNTTEGSAMFAGELKFHGEINENKLIIGYAYDPYKNKTRGEQGGADQPATAPESKPDGEEKPEPGAEVRSR